MSVPRPLQILEILRNILSHCEDQTNLQNVLVCKSWSEIALDVLWYEVTDLRRFVALFGRETDDRNSTWEYVETPSFTSWQRFEKVYQNRIRKLAPRSPDTKYLPALGVISKIRTGSPLLPKLHTLEWFGLSGAGLAEPSVMFMHESVRAFRVDELSHTVFTSSFTSWCEAVSTRMPFLDTLTFCVSPSQKCQKLLLALAQRLPNLKNLHIPCFRDPSVMLLGLQDKIAPKLTTFEICSLDNHPPTSVLKGPPQYPAFNDLQKLTAYCTYSFATQLSRRISSKSMRDIDVISMDPDLETSENVRGLISQIASSFHTLKSLALTFTRLKSCVLDHMPLYPSVDVLVQLQDLYPLLNNCKNITCLELHSPYPPSLDDADIETICRSWPHLETFRLCHQPGRLLPRREKRLTLKALSHFSFHCPDIRTLGLYVDATRRYIPDFTSVELERFQNLKNLEFGPSPIDNPARVAQCLAQLCDFELPTITFGSDWENPDKVSVDINTKWKDKWEAVQGALEVMIEMQEKIDKLEKEVESLRSETGAMLWA
ncbi:hypothetical protein C8J55DRAFT_564642 [Lentinula edodes]|uniref:F-box domain-containing protein n=1 Tax=Lentinula lateritia TaxID=40482 RepID=A0A9W8ZWR5_9AGAR|nr:hypothetical protein C8J55DRAFT_564642 [Lentinula edodes]